MQTSPSVRHWDAFLKIYGQISPVAEARHRIREAFKTFEGHVLATTGKVISLGDLPKESASKLIRDGLGYECEKFTPILGEKEDGH